MSAATVGEALGLVAALALAAWFRPWRALGPGALRHPWLASLVLLPWLWALPRALPGPLPVHLTLACLTVLMFGWPLAVWTVVAAAAAGAALAGLGWAQALSLAWWLGVVPATLALLIGLATRRWLPRHLMVYILARAFLGTAAACTLAAVLWLAAAPPADPTDGATLLLGRALMAWGEAFTTGALAAIFVAFKPEWLLTYSDARYLPRAPR